MAEAVELRDPVELPFGHLNLVLGRSDGGAVHWLIYAPGLAGPAGRSIVSGFGTGEAALTAAQLRAAAREMEIMEGSTWNAESPAG